MGFDRGAKASRVDVSSNAIHHEGFALVFRCDADGGSDRKIKVLREDLDG